VQNILTRVTGGSISNIDGLIQANGTANLFLLNPNGIIFGANASLNVGGSFVASTADRLHFDNGFAFSASNPQAPPLLTINVPIGLQYGSNPGSVQVQGATLRVAPGQTLALLGGTVSINGGRLLAPEGRVELGGVAAQGSLGLQANGASLSWSFSDAVGRADLFIDQQAELNVRGNDRGSIAINARNIKISGNSRVQAGILVGAGSPQSQVGDIELNATAAVQVTGDSLIANNTEGEGNAGAVRITAQDFVSFDGKSVAENVVLQGAVGNTGGIVINTGSLFVTSDSALNSVIRGKGNAGSITINARNTVSFDGVRSLTRTGVYGEGNGGDINITTDSLFLRNGSTLFSGIVGGKGNAGSINIDARDTITIDGGDRVHTRFNQTSGIRSNVFEGEGQGGDINITTGSLFVTNGGVLNANDQSLQGNSTGSITINARDTVSFDGVNSIGIPSRVLSNVSSQQGKGKGGDINITTQSLSVRNGAYLGVQATGQGDGGNITVNANTIDVVNGGQFITTSFGNGKAGNITFNATNSINLSGSDPTYYDRLARVNQVDPDFSFGDAGPSSGLFANTASTSTNEGGSIRVNTEQLTVRDGAQITVSSTGLGGAGNVEVLARAITLDNQAYISADTTGGGGNINLRSPLILLRNGSSISTDARGINIPGGNITIDTDNLVAIPKEDSDITANSEDFRGGNVTVRANGIFGIEFRDQLSPLSNITATGVSEEYSGTVEIITPGIDPARGLAQLPTEVVDASDEIAQGCRDVQGSSFVVTGRGGLPPTPQQALGDDPRWRDWRTPAVISRQLNAPGNRTLPPSTNHPSTKSALVEATGWVIEPSGKVILTASAPNVTSPNRWGQPVNCDGS
jgi:filamentous hemagglutinin family protein